MLSFAVKSNSAVLNPKSENTNSKQYQNSNVQNSKHQEYNPPWQKLFLLGHWDFGVVGTHCGRYNSGRRM
jgi:hypothetical protein